MRPVFFRFGYLRLRRADPEDLTLVTGGVISGLGYTNSHIMFAVGMLGVLVGDGFMFAAGRDLGTKNP